jgi:hypothetical protein
VQEQEKLQAKSLMEEALEIQINDPLRADDVDLRTLVSHRTAVQANDNRRICVCSVRQRQC